MFESRLKKYEGLGYVISRDGFSEGIVAPSGRIYNINGSLLSKGAVPDASVPKEELAAVTDIANIIYTLEHKKG